MITDKTLDEALVEILRTKKALEALRESRKVGRIKDDAEKRTISNGMIISLPGQWSAADQRKEHAAALRASLDLTRKLADLRQGR